MPSREIIPTHSAYLELKAERGGMQEGYHFLDEKRLILASEILATLKDFEATMARWRDARGEALVALRAALGRHGLEELSVYPAAAPLACDAAADSRSVLGVRIDQLPPAESLDAPSAHAVRDALQRHPKPGGGTLSPLFHPPVADRDPPCAAHRQPGAPTPGVRTHVPPRAGARRRVAARDRRHAARHRHRVGRTGAGRGGAGSSRRACVGWNAKRFHRAAYAPLAAQHRYRYRA